eukprot:6492352-Amphidinium_carterae.1
MVEDALHAQGEGAHDRALSWEIHCRTHYPKRPDCPVCQSQDGTRVLHKRVPFPTVAVLHLDLAHIDRTATWPYCLVCVLRCHSGEGKLMCLPWFIPLRSKLASEAANVIVDLVLKIRDEKNLAACSDYCVRRVHSDGDTQFCNALLAEKLRAIGVTHSVSQPYQPASNGVAERYVGILKSLMNRLFKQASLEPAVHWHYAAQMAGAILRERSLERPWTLPGFGEEVAVWRLHAKDLKRTFDPQGLTGRLLYVDPWSNSLSYILLPSGEVAKGLKPVLLDPTVEGVRGDPMPTQPAHDIFRNRVWKALRDPSQRLMWVHMKTGKTRWTTPYEVSLHVDDHTSVDVLEAIHTDGITLPEVEVNSHIADDAHFAAFGALDNDETEHQETHEFCGAMDMPRDTGPYREEVLEVPVHLVSDPSLKNRKVQGVTHHPVSTREVLQSINEEKLRWVAAIDKEWKGNFLKLDAVRKASPEEVTEAYSCGNTPVPMLMVFSRKKVSLEQQKQTGSAFKEKARIVISGDRANMYSGDTKTSNADPSVLRMLLSYYAGPDTMIAGVDIALAFLNAAVPVKVLTRPPHAMVELGYFSKADYLVLNKAVYGLRESPKWWEDERDRVLREARWHDQKGTWCLQQSRVHPSLWHVIASSSHNPQPDTQDLLINAHQWPDLSFTMSSTPVASILVYVDDMLSIGPSEHVNGFLQWLQTQWTTSEPEYLSADSEKSVEELSFIGLTIERVNQENASEELPEGTFLLHQHDYVFSTLEKFSSSLTIAPKPAPGVAESFKEEQKRQQDRTTREEDARTMKVEVKPHDCNDMPKPSVILGSLLWLSTRSRPDICWSVSRAASMASSSPQECLNACAHIVRYLAHAPDYSLVFKPVSRSSHARKEIWVTTDASWAPSGGRSQTGITIFHGTNATSPSEGNLISWRSVRQPFTTLSSAEAEVIAATTGTQDSLHLLLALSELAAETPTA